MTKVSIVILNWNRKDDTLACLESIEKLKIEGFELEIVVVDNGSSDDSIRVLSNYKSELAKYKLIKNQKNLGFTGGNNKGIKYSLTKGADYIMVLNNDTVVDSNLIVGLLGVVNKNSEIGAVSPKIYFAKGFEFHKSKYKDVDLGKVIWYAGGDIDWDNVYGSNHGVDEVDKGQFDNTVETDFVTGACTLFNSKALIDVGLYNDKYFMYFEDSDLSQRMRRSEWKVIYSPRAKLWHKVAQSSAIGADLNDYFITRNRLLFGIKYAKPKTRFALIRESIRLLVNGRDSQKQGIKDFYLMKFGRGSWNTD